MLVVASLLCVAISLLIVWPVDSTLVRVVAGFPLLFVLPGYAIVSAVFPRRSGNVSPTRARERFALPSRLSREGVTTAERFALAYGLSVAVLPVIALALTVTVGLSLESLLIVLGSVVLICVVVGAVRRLRLPRDERYALPVSRWATHLSESVQPDRRLSFGLSVLVAGLLVVSTATLGYALVAPISGESYSELALLTETDDGEHVAGDYPDDLGPGETGSIVAEVTNHEGERTEYTLVVLLQEVDREDGTLEVVEETELERASRTVESGDQWHHTHQLSTPATGEDQRVMFLLYLDEPPATPDADSAAYRSHIWLDGEPDEGG
ncbi:MAG: DUF1616 domain-containing protein [Halobacteriota archaeon]